MHSSGQTNSLKMTNLLIVKIHNMEKTCTVCGAATEMHGPIQETWLSKTSMTTIVPFMNELFYRSWYDEVKQYTWNVEPKGSFKAGQFSQMVWKNSKELGIGLGRTKTGKVVVVASKNFLFLT